MIFDRFLHIDMGKEDARKQSREDLHARRREVIALRQAGVPVMQIVASSGLSWSAVNRAIKLYEARGDTGLEPGRRGKKQAVGRKLTEEQERDICQAISKKQPKSYGIDAHLWSRKVVAELIKDKYNVSLSERALGNYLGRWGLKLDSATKPHNRRCSREVRAWLDRHFCEVAQQARSEGAEIFWINKPVNLGTDQWVPGNDMTGPSPESLCANGQRADDRIVRGNSNKTRMFSAVSGQGKLVWIVSRDRSNYAAMMMFLRALIRESRCRTRVLILHDAGYYRNQDAEDFVKCGRKTLRIYPERQDLGR